MCFCHDEQEVTGRDAEWGANRGWSADVEVQAARRKASSNEPPVVSLCMSLECQPGNEVLFRQRLCQFISPLLVGKYLCV